MNKLIPVEIDGVIAVERDILQKNQELGRFIDEVSRAVFDNADVFGGKSGNLWVRAIFSDKVIVFDFHERRFVKANMKREKNGITFSNSKLVEQQWIEVGKLERTEDDKSYQFNFELVGYKRSQRIWGNLFDFSGPNVVGPEPAVESESTETEQTETEQDG